MKFLWVLLVYVVFASILGWGILLTIRGNPWLLITGLLGYAVLLAKIGLLPKKTPH